MLDPEKNRQELIAKGHELVDENNRDPGRRVEYENGVARYYTPAEEDQRGAEEAADALAKPLRLWKEDMAATDAAFPRAVEDLHDAMDADTQARLPSATKNGIMAKKALRATRPE